MKCKQVIRNVLAAELYKIVYEFDIRAVISAILYIDSKILYNCLVKLSTTQKKQLIVNMMSLHQFYKRQEISKVK